MTGTSNHWRVRSTSGLKPMGAEERAVTTVVVNLATKSEWKTLKTMHAMYLKKK